MTELLERVMAKLKVLPADEQDAIASRFLDELDDDEAWKVQFAATTDDQWDNLAKMVRREITAGDVSPLDDIFLSI